MNKGFFRRKAQSMVEMAILGPLMIVALGIVATYIAKLNGDQYQLMEAFRRALAQSHTENKAIGYGTWDDRRQVDASNPIIGHKITSSGAGYVMWAIPSVEGEGESPKGKLWVKINYIPYDLGDEGSGAITPMYITGTSENLHISTVNGQVSSRRTAGVVEAMTYKIGDKRYPQARGHGGSR